MRLWNCGPESREQERGAACNQIRAIKIQKPIARTGRRLCGNWGCGGVRGNPQRRQKRAHDGIVDPQRAQ
jgi:hypothetical protein